MLRIKQSDMSYDTALWLINQDREISGQCIVEFDDGDVSLPVRPMILMLPYWEIYRKMNIPVSTDHIFFTGPPYNESVYNKIMQRIYNECFEDNADDEYFDRLKTALWDTINNIDDFGTHELLEYVCGLSIIDLSEIREDPEVKKIVDVDISEDLGPMIIKKKIINATDDLAKMLEAENAIKADALYPYMSCGALKKSQLYQVLGHYGLRTEINDRVFRRPVYGNSINGLMNFTDLVLENSASRKNVYYSHDAIRLSQYFNREMSLICGIMANLYKGFCGHDVTLPIYLDPEYAMRCLGRYFYLPDDSNRTLRVLTMDNIQNYLNRWIQMYSPITCGHTDGICERCLGLISRNYTQGVNVGMTASSNAVSEISQLILSTKHEDSAVPTVYTIPEEAAEWFRIDKGGIRLQPQANKRLDRLQLGIFYKDIYYSNGDLEYINSDMDVPETKYSGIKSIMIKDTKTGIYQELVMERDEMVPFLTTEFLIYLREHLNNGIIEEEDLFWVPLADMAKKPIPIMRSIVYNNSMMVYVTHLTEMFKKKHLCKYRDASKAVMDFSKVIFERVKNMNMFQLEILIRAHSITSKYNYSMPVIDDPANVLFERTKEVIENRTISGQLAHEGHNNHFENPLTFMTLKDQNVLDPFVGV